MSSCHVPGDALAGGHSDAQNEIVEFTSHRGTQINSWHGSKCYRDEPFGNWHLKNVYPHTYVVFRSRTGFWVGNHFPRNAKAWLCEAHHRTCNLGLPLFITRRFIPWGLLKLCLKPDFLCPLENLRFLFAPSVKFHKTAPYEEGHFYSLTKGLLIEKIRPSALIKDLIFFLWKFLISPVPSFSNSRFSDVRPTGLFWFSLQSLCIFFLLFHRRGAFTALTFYYLRCVICAIVALISKSSFL